MIHAWTPPPCGLSKPAPSEAVARDDERDADGPAHLVDGDAWSDSDDEVAVVRRTHAETGRRRGQKRARSRGR